MTVRDEELERMKAENARLRARLFELEEPEHGSWVGVTCAHACGKGAEHPPYGTPRDGDTGKRYVYYDCAWVCPDCAREAYRRLLSDVEAERLDAGEFWATAAFQGWMNHPDRQ